LLRQAFEANPPPMVKGRRLKLFYAAQAREKLAAAAGQNGKVQAPGFVLFVNDPRLLNDTYRRYLEARIREAEPYPGLPIILSLRPRAGVRHKQRAGLIRQGKKQPAGRWHRV
jgi:GTP-binding protein